MNFFKTISDVNSRIRELSNRERINILLISLIMFLLLFSYPMIGGTVESILLSSYGAKAGPYAWIWSVVVLSGVIWFFNFFQIRLSIHKLFLISVVLVVVIFLTLLFMVENGLGKFAYGLYVLKEVYIVVLVHATLGFLNVCIDKDLAKIIYGPLGAVGSLGGIFGGMFVTTLIRSLGVNGVLLCGVAIIFLCGFVFGFTDRHFDLKELDKKSPSISPLASIGEVRKYVFLIVAMVVLSQFCINMTQHKFNMFLVDFVADKNSKAEFLGKVYAIYNALAMGLQFLVIPFIFKVFRDKWIHLGIPTTFLVVTVVGMGMGGLLPVAAAFIIFKGVDYSLFSAGKELLYFSLDAKQKYGAKYITDMVAYRFAKGLISLVLIFVSTTSTINALIGVFLLLWGILIIPLFKCQPHGDKSNEQSLASKV